MGAGPAQSGTKGKRSITHKVLLLSLLKAIIVISAVTGSCPDIMAPFCGDVFDERPQVSAHPSSATPPRPHFSSSNSGTTQHVSHVPGPLIFTGRFGFWFKGLDVLGRRDRVCQIEAILDLESKI